MSVEYAAGRFSRFALTRRDGGNATFGFSQLSVGEKEQVAAAFRLPLPDDVHQPTERAGFIRARFPLSRILCDF